MADDPKETGADRRVLSLEQDREVRDRTKSLGCTEEQLRAAVRTLGNSAEKVREYLKKQSSHARDAEKLLDDG